MRIQIKEEQKSIILKYILFFVISLFILEHLASTAEVVLNIVSDAAGYLGMSKKSFFSLNYWFSMRPIGYPTFIKIMHSNPNLVAGMQSLFYMGSWVFFSIYIYNKSKNKIFGLISAIGILYITIQPDMSLWTHHLLTESLTFTLLAWILIFLHEFILSSKKVYLYLLLFVLLYYSTIRDVNAFYTITFIVTFIVLYLYKYFHKRTLFVATILVLSALLFSTYSANNSGTTYLTKRWTFSFFNLTGFRFLPNEEVLTYMKKNGMVENDALLRKKNIWASRKDDKGLGWYNDPELEQFRRWAMSSGKSVYTKFLITHPSYTFGSIYSNYKTIFHIDSNLKPYYLKGYKTDSIFSYSTIKNITFYTYLSALIILIFLLSLILRKNIFNKNTVPFLTLLIPIWLLTIITYHGDAMEVSRHTLIVPILLKVTLFMIAYVFGNELFVKMAAKDANEFKK